MASWMCLSAIRVRARRPVARLPRSGFPSRPTGRKPMARALRRRSARRAAISLSGRRRPTSARPRPSHPAFSCEIPALERLQPARHPRNRWISSSVARASACGVWCAQVPKIPPAEACATQQAPQSGKRKTRSEASSTVQGCGSSRNDSHSCLKTSACT